MVKVIDTKTYTKYIAEDKSEYDTVEEAEARNEWLSFRKAYQEVDPFMFSKIEEGKYLSGCFTKTERADFISMLRVEFQTLHEAFKRFEEGE